MFYSLAQGVSLLVGIFLPSVGVSLYFYSLPKSFDDINSNEDNQKNLHISDGTEEKPKFSYSRATNLLWRHFLDSYSNPKILQWSLWWSLAMAGFLMVQIYVQLLWQEIDVEREFLFNAGVEATLTLFGAIAAFFAGFLTSETFQRFDLWIISICSLLEGIFIVVSSQTTSIWIAYTMYILFGVLYTFMITIASATVAQHLADDSFALIFGINTFFALIFQSVLTVLVISWLELNTRDQFLVYGFYFVALSLIYLVTSLVKLLFFRNSSEYSVRD